MAVAATAAAATTLAGGTRIIRYTHVCPGAQSPRARFTGKIVVVRETNIRAAVSVSLGVKSPCLLRCSFSAFPLHTLDRRRFCTLRVRTPGEFRETHIRESITVIVSPADATTPAATAAATAVASAAALPRPDGMNRRGSAPSRVAVVVAVASSLLSLCCRPAAVAADTVSADVLPDGEIEIRVSAGNVTAKQTSFASPDTGYVVYKNPTRVKPPTDSRIRNSLPRKSVTNLSRVQLRSINVDR